MTYFEIMQQPGREIHPKLYYYDSTNTKIEIDQDDIETSKMVFNATLTGTVMQGLEVTTSAVLPLSTAIYFQNTAKYDTNHATKTYGPYFIKESSYNADSKTYDYKLYDGFLNAMVDYKPITINYPTTVLDFFKQLCSELGYTTSITSLPNGSRQVSMDIYDGIGFTYRDVLDDIGNATATLFRINDHDVQKCGFGTSSITVDDDLLKNQNITLGEHFGPINCIVLSRAGESDNVYKRDTTLTSWNEWKIVDNQLMNDNNRSDYLDELYSTLYGIEYDIFDLELVGYGGFNPLGKVSITTNDTTYTSYVFNNEIEFSQGVTECIYTEMPEESVTDYTAASTTDKQINQTYIIANKNTQKIQAVVSQIGDRSEKQTTITQDIDTISQQVSESVEFTKEATQNNYLVIEDGFQGNLLKFSLVGEMSLLYPNDDLYPSDDLYPIDSYLVIEDSDGNQNKVLLPIVYLHYLNANAYDEFILEQGQAKIIRRVGENEDGSLYALGTEITEDKGEYEIPVFTGYNKIWMESFFDISLRYYAKYASQNDYTDVFATKIELNSSITQTKNEIDLTTTEKIENATDTDELIAKINLKPGQILLEGTVTANENFKILQDGSIEAVNGNFTGNIYLENGNIVVGGDGLMTNLQFQTWGQYLGKNLVGFGVDMSTPGAATSVKKNDLGIVIQIPNNFAVKHAYATINHSRVQNSVQSGTVIGYCRKLKLYKASSNASLSIWSDGYGVSGWVAMGSYYGTEIQGAFGSDGYTATNTNSDTCEIVQSSDIASSLTKGTNILFLSTSETTSSTVQDVSDAASKTGAIQLTIDVIGYMNFTE